MTETFRPIPEGDYFKNPGYLKLDLMLNGVRVDPSLFQKSLILKEYRLSPSLCGNLDLILPEETHVSVPYQEEFTIHSPYKLRGLHGKYTLSGREHSAVVKIVPHPSFYDERVNSAVRIGDVAQCHGGYVSLALGGHRYLQSHLNGSSGALSTAPATGRLVLSVDEVIGLLDRIRKETAIDVITLSAWSAKGEDGGILQIEPYIRAIKASFNVLLLVEVHLPNVRSMIDQTYAMGADSVCYHLGNLCSHGDQPPAPGRSTEQELHLLRHAVSIFPPGSILSHITMGSRPFAEVIEDIGLLTGIKVLPILTVEGLEVVRQKGLTTAQLAPLFGYVYNAAKRAKITMNWFSRLAPFVAPIEGRFFSGDSPKLKLALLNFYQSRFLGGSISAGLSNLRRKLRVREVKK
ncbi:MAG: hypothetical protein HY541_08760 [Deltaproteobacteria bacterium]|nr:hypothetical protein [Deltaproteobacteria bacterium]